MHPDSWWRRPPGHTRDRTATAARDARARERRWDPVGERAGAAAQGRRRAPRRVRARDAAPRGRLVARPPRAAATAARAAVRGVREARAEDGRVPLLLRADPRPEIAAVPTAARAAEEERLPLPRLRHPRQVAHRARLRRARRRRDRRLVRRAALGAAG